MKKNGKVNLIIKNDSRINITNYDYPIPELPSQYIRSLRKLLKNRKIVSISQYEFDRIITFELYFSEGKNWKFIIELFNKGNYIVVDEENKVKIARNYAKFKERDILANRAYQYPASSGVNILMVEKERFMSTLKESKEEIIRVLVRKIGLSGLYSEEICLRGNIDPNTYIKDLNNDDFELLYEALCNTHRIKNIC
jgi:predicted ribosome quality control (RQC) complex YloA/Tae2 family protein